MPNTKPTPRPPRVRYPVLADWPPGVFCPAAVGKVRGYPRTQETYDRQVERLRANSKGAIERGLLTRKGIPNGWAGMRVQIAELRQEADDEAWRMVNVIQRNSVSPDERLDDDCLAELQADTRPAKTDAERFALAAAYCLGLMLDTTQPKSLRLKAARTILPFLAPMPRRAKAGLGGSLAWLDAVVAGGLKAGL